MKRFFPILFLILSCLLTSFDKNTFEQGDEDKFVIVLDAGHGGHDPGNLGNGYLEKNITLKIVLKVGEILSRNPNIKVIYTRNDDSFVDLYLRGEIANKSNADLFVSVHCDSHTSDANGAGTFVLGLHANKQNFEIAKKENSVIYLEDNYESRYAEYDINSPESVIGLTIMQEEFLDQSIMLAKMMQDNFSIKLKRNNRKVKQAGFIVLHQTFMPSVLIEAGFLTNKNEGGYLNSKNGQSEMGIAIAEAILKYSNEIQANVVGVSNKITPEVSIPEPENPEKKEVVAEVVEKTENTHVDSGAEKTEEIKKEVATVEIKLPEVAKDSPKVAEVVIKEPTQPVPVVKEEKKESVASTVEDKKDVTATANIIFKVQLLASSKDLPLRSEDFKGLNRLSKEPYKNLYRYMYGSANTHAEAKLLKENAGIKGYITSYIVAYKDGKRIPLSEALKYVSQ